MGLLAPICSAQGTTRPASAAQHALGGSNSLPTTPTAPVHGAAAGRGSESVLDPFFKVFHAGPCTAISSARPNGYRTGRHAGLKSGVRARPGSCCCPLGCCWNEATERLMTCCSRFVAPHGAAGRPASTSTPARCGNRAMARHRPGRSNSCHPRRPNSEPARRPNVPQTKQDLPVAANRLL